MNSAYTTDAAGRHIVMADPSSELDYTFDWTEWLAAKGQVASSMSIVAIDSPITTTSQSNTPSQCILVLKMNNAPANSPLLKVSCKIVTAGPVVLTDTRSIYFRIRPR
jgi:hypothetical protein